MIMAIIGAVGGNFWNLSASNIAQLLMLIIILRRVDYIWMEHEMLMSWYCECHNMKIEDLPTRQRRWGLPSLSRRH